MEEEIEWEIFKVRIWSLDDSKRNVKIDFFIKETNALAVPSIITVSSKIIDKKNRKQLKDDLLLNGFYKKDDKALDEKINKLFTELSLIIDEYLRSFKEPEGISQDEIDICPEEQIMNTLACGYIDEFKFVWDVTKLSVKYDSTVRDIWACFYNKDEQRGVYYANSERLVKIEDTEFFVRNYPVILKGFISQNGLAQFLNGKTPDLDSIFEEIVKRLKEFLEFSHECTYTVYALWLIATYFYRQCLTFPYLHFLGPHETGKTRALILGDSYAFHSVKIDNVTVSPIFRYVNDAYASLFLDEFEKGIKKDAEILQLINAGYKRGGFVARVEQTTSGEFTVVLYDAYSPKTFASIQDLNPTTQSRCLQIIMPKCQKSEIVNKKEDFRFAQETRDELYMIRLFLLPKFKELYENGVEIPSEIEGRLHELLEPLFVTSSLLKDCENVKKDLIEFGIIQKKLKEAESTESEEGIVSDAIEELLDDPEKENLTADGYMQVKLITDLIKEKGYDWWTAQRTGRVLKRMGFTDKKKITGYMYVKITKKNRYTLLRYSTISTNSTNSTNDGTNGEIGEFVETLGKGIGKKTNEILPSELVVEIVSFLQKKYGDVHIDKISALFTKITGMDKEKLEGYLKRLVDFGQIYKYASKEGYYRIP